MDPDSCILLTINNGNLDPSTVCKMSRSYDPGSYILGCQSDHAGTCSKHRESLEELWCRKGLWLVSSTVNQYSKPLNPEWSFGFLKWELWWLWNDCTCRCFSSSGEASNVDDYLWLMSQAKYKPIIEYCGGTEIGGGFVTGSMLQPQALSAFSTPAMGCKIIILDDHGLPLVSTHTIRLIWIPIQTTVHTNKTGCMLGFSHQINQQLGSVLWTLPFLELQFFCWMQTTSTCITKECHNFKERWVSWIPSLESITHVFMMNVTI